MENLTHKTQPFWFGVHLLVHNNTEMDDLFSQIPAMAQLGVNAIITEINYNYAFTSHPELQEDSLITRESVQELFQISSDHDIELIPQFQCLGHQSWDKNTFPLLTVYPEFDETPGKYPENADIYCRSWCPQHPRVNAVVFDLIDELLDAFQARSIHIGMDEVFLIGSEYCPRCAGHDPAELFATAVNTLHTHIVKEKGYGIMMWGDRLLDDAITGYGEWEAATNGTHPAIDMISNDIVMCDWHYTHLKEYPSIPIFLDKGFKVIPSGWHEVPAAEALFDYALSFDNPAMLGYLCTTWGRVKPKELSQFPALQAISTKLLRHS